MLQFDFLQKKIDCKITNNENMFSNFLVDI